MRIKFFEQFALRTQIWKGNMKNIWQILLKGLTLRNFQVLLIFTLMPSFDLGDVCQSTGSSLIMHDVFMLIKLFKRIWVWKFFIKTIYNINWTKKIKEDWNCGQFDGKKFYFELVHRNSYHQSFNHWHQIILICLNRHPSGLQRQEAWTDTPEPWTGILEP